MIRIAVDAMGGDRGPETILEGALDAARQGGLSLSLVGDEALLSGLLASRFDPGPLDIGIVHAAEVIGMGEPPTSALRRRPGASIRVAAAEVASGRAAALFSTGNTGATVMAAHAAFGMLGGAERPALAAIVPTRAASAVLLDVGANVECRPQHLVQFAAMGAVYAHLALGVEHPRVGLLSIGEEETKGNELTREAHQLLKAGRLEFIGNIEARQVYAGGADVIVCDGFTGNIVLKVCEGLVDLMRELLADGVARLDPDLARAVGPVLFDRFEHRVDDAEYGAVPLLGVAGLALIGHGCSSARAVRQGVLAAGRFASEGFIGRLEQGLASAGVGYR
jgi:glycerol-3-phosphate acyltransferase PlsX